MHKLTRPNEPTGLSHYQHGRDKWDNVSQEHREEIWQKIHEMQKGRCAYCEFWIKTTSKKCHIEHFRQQSRYPQGTFSWSNLFGSCNRKDSCGKHKDSPKNPLKGYCHRDLIKMDDEDPENFLTFLPDGKVFPTKGLSRPDERRAEKTIRIFNLNGSLRQIRKSALKCHLKKAEKIADYADKLDKSEWVPILQEELDDIKDLPFATAIKHTLTPTGYYDQNIQP